MTTTEHLQLIKAECERLLAIAEKRTPGMWTVHEHRATWTSYLVRGGEKKNQLAQTFNWQDNGFDINSEHNAKYIAACAGCAEAGCAEAGWRSTIAAIESIWKRGSEDGYEAYNILAAWPLELLQHTDHE